MEPVKIHWKHHVAGLADVKIDFGDLGGEGKNFIIGCELNIAPPPDPKTRTLGEYHAWRNKASLFILGDVSVLLSYPPGVVVSNYLLRPYETILEQDYDYTTVAMDDLFFAKNGEMIRAAFKKSEEGFSAIRYTIGLPESKEQAND